MLYTNPPYMGAERSLDCGITSEIANCEVFLNLESYITVKFLSDIEYKTFKQAYALDFFFQLFGKSRYYKIDIFTFK